MVKIESEKELENYLAKQLKSIPGFTTTQQVRMGEYGIADIVTWTTQRTDNGNTLVAYVIETKAANADFKALAQLCRYMKGLELSLISTRNLIYNTLKYIEVFGLLVCERITDVKNTGFLLAQMQNVHIYKYTVSLENGLNMRRWPGWMRGISKNPANHRWITPERIIEVITKTANEANKINERHPYFPI